MKILRKILTRSLLAANTRHQMICKLIQIFPDITDQYNSISIEGEYLTTKIRCQHAFQIELALRVIEDGHSIVDIGDSSGVHTLYLKEFRAIHAASINIDNRAIVKIKEKGLQAYENWREYDTIPDVTVCFQTLEHIPNPIGFLRAIKSQMLVITVPFLKKSRVKCDRGIPEPSHIFEFSPADWKKVFRYCNWLVDHEEIYLQYPKKGIYRLTQPLWKRYDFEGFYGVILRKEELEGK